MNIHFLTMHISLCNLDRNAICGWVGQAEGQPHAEIQQLAQWIQEPMLHRQQTGASDPAAVCVSGVDLPL